MSLVSQINMPASNLLHTLIHPDSNLKRKRYLDDLDVLDNNDSKRSRTAPPSPPLMSASAAGAFRGRSLSPTPPSSTLDRLPISPPTNAPESPIQVEKKISPAVSAPTSSYTKSEPLPHLPPVSSFSHPSTTVSSTAESLLKPIVQDSGLKLPSLKFLTNADRYSGISRYSLNYPDTCVNDDDWRMNLEVWIEKNFPEKFNNLKNMLRIDKPGFDLLNDAIFLTELKEQLDSERSDVPSSSIQHFNSRVSTKMQNRRASIASDHSDHVQSTPSKPAPLLPTFHTSSSPIASNSQLHSSSSYHFDTPNYTYSTHTPHSPTSNKSHSSPHKLQTSPSSSRTWKGHHKLDQSQQVLSTNFIHSQTHKGPNHTYTIHHHNAYKRHCISCGTDQSPCWRPSWSVQAGQLCNSCGLRYKKTGARCVEKSCSRIPAKGEWLAMENRGKLEVKKEDGSVVVAYRCLHCAGEVEVKEKK